MDEYESVILVKHEVFVYKIPPRTTTRGYRAADWNLGEPDWTGKLKVVNKANECIMKLEDKNTGELFAKCPIDQYPGIAVEAVLDSSRYFVIRIQDDGGRSAFIGLGFADRSDSFDLNVALQDHFKWVKKEEEIKDEDQNKPQLDLSFKEGQTITINMKIGQKQTGGASSRPRTKPAGSIGLLPPPPGGGAAKVATASTPSPSGDISNVDLLGGLVGSAPSAPANPTTKATPDLWGDFASATPTTGSGAANSNANTGANWVQF